MRIHRVVLAVAFLVTAGGIGPFDSAAGATEFVVNGSCVLEVEAVLSGDTLMLDSTSALNVCVTNEGVGDAMLDFTLPGLVGFECTNGVVAGVGTGASGKLRVTAGGSTVLFAEGMLVVGTSDGTTLNLAFEFDDGVRVVAGQGTFVRAVGSSCSAESTTTTWTGEIVFGDPVLP